MKAYFSITANPWLVFLVTAAGAILTCLDVGIVNVALPTITERFTASNILLSQWVVSSYLFVICITLPLWGKLGDTYSRNKIYLFGFVIFTVSSFLCGIAASIHQLIYFRCLQGLGAAMILANNQAIIVATMPKEKRGIALGLNSAFSSVGFIAGPGLGGLMLAFFSWRSIFYINIPIGIIGCILGCKILTKNSPRTLSKIDVFGAILFAIGMYLSLLFLNDLGEEISSATTILVCILTASISWIFFYLWERYIHYPILDFKLFSNKKFLSGIIMAFIVMAICGTNGILLPFYLQNQLHLSTAICGLLLLIPPLFTIILSPFSGYLSDRLQQNTLANIGLILTTLSLVYQFFLTQNSYLVHIIISQAILGIGLGMFHSPNNYTILTNVPTEHISISSSISSLMRNTGRIFGTISATVSFAIVQNHYATKANKIIAFLYGFKTAFLITIILSLIGIGIVWYGINKDTTI